MENTTAIPNVEMYAVSCAPNRDLCRYLHIDQYPFFRVYRPEDCSNISQCDTDGMDIPHAQINPAIILQQMGISLQQQEQQLIANDNNVGVVKHANTLWQWGNKMFPWIFVGSMMASTLESAKNNDKNHMRKYETARSRDELRDDIHTSFDYAMRYAVYTSTNPNDDEKQYDDDDSNFDTSLSVERAVVLKEWLHLLQKTLPISYTKLHHCIKALIDQFDYVQRSELFMLSILDEYTPSKHAVWSTSCSYGMMDTGYTCGLWLLLHTITVGAVDYNRNVAFPKHRLSTESVAINIRNYIDTFFACEICRQNFVSTFDNCGHNRCRTLHAKILHDEEGWIKLPLWLFETHNAVNVRLLHEKGKRDNITITNKDIISVMWPLTRDCPKCWVEHDDTTIATTATTIQRNDDMIYKYLKVEYGQLDALYTKYQEEIQADINKEESIQQSDLLESGKVETTSVTNSRILENMITSIASLRFHLGMVPTLDAREAASHRFVIRELQEKVFVKNLETITNTKSTILIDWLTLLRRTLPVTWSGLHSLIEELLNNWTYVCKSKDYLFAIVSEYPPPDNIQNGFVIASFLDNFSYDESMHFLDLLHIVSVGVVQYNKFIVSSDEERLSTSNVIETIRKYTSQVFVSARSKTVRRNSTVQDSMNYVCESNGICDTYNETPGTEQDWIALPMWMYKVHNEVLQRGMASKNNQLLPLAISKTNHIPLSIDCPKCWIDSASRQWDDDYVYKCLILLYGPERTLGVGLRHEMYGLPLWESVIGSLRKSVRGMPLLIFQRTVYNHH